MCIDILLFNDHNCKAGKYNSNCPVCQEDLFSSRKASHEMPCGHAIHWDCFKELTSFDTRCPVCKKTAETPEQMASTWSALAMGIALQPVPPDLARVVNVFCNDCEERDYERRWHFLGVRCMNCLSFNTNVEQIVLQGIEAAQYLDAQEAARGEETGGVPPNISAMALQANGNDEDEDDDAMMDNDSDPDPLWFCRVADKQPWSRILRASSNYHSSESYLSHFILRYYLFYEDGQTITMLFIIEWVIMVQSIVV